MIEQTRGSAHTQIVYGPYGMKLALMNAQTFVNAFVKLPSGASAVYNSSGLAFYRHSDHLGSSRLSTTTTRTKYYDVAYAPYGEDYNGSGTTPDLAFTDQNQDTVKGGWSANLYDFMFREYRTAHGRWTSPDPAGLGAVDPANPQSWNRYAYVLNSPTNLFDPLGLVQQCFVNSTYFWTSTTGAAGANSTPVYAGMEALIICYDIPDGLFNSLKPGAANNGPTISAAGPQGQPQTPQPPSHVVQLICQDQAAAFQAKFDADMWHGGGYAGNVLGGGAAGATWGGFFTGIYMALKTNSATSHAAYTMAYRQCISGQYN